MQPFETHSAEVAPDGATWTPIPTSVISSGDTSVSVEPAAAEHSILTLPGHLMLPLASGKKHQRAKITTNKGRGTPKGRKQMAKESRRRNRHAR
jgi:hypothetical protein